MSRYYTSDRHDLRALGTDGLDQNWNDEGARRIVVRISPANANSPSVGPHSPVQSLGDLSDSLVDQSSEDSRVDEFVSNPTVSPTRKTECTGHHIQHRPVPPHGGMEHIHSTIHEAGLPDQVANLNVLANFDNVSSKLVDVLAIFDSVFSKLVIMLAAFDNVFTKLVSVSSKIVNVLSIFDNVFLKLVNVLAIFDDVFSKFENVS